MKLARFATLLATAIPTAFGAVANITALQAQNAKNLAVRMPDKIQCRPTNPDNWVEAGLDNIRRYQIPHLDFDNKLCDVRPGPDGCGRISCAWGNGIFICQNNITEPIEFMCHEAASWARRIVEVCGEGDSVMGAAIDAEYNFSVEVFHQKC